MKVNRVVCCVGLLLALLGCATTPTRAVEVPGLRLSFRIDKRADAENVLNLFRNDDPAGLESRAMSMGVDVELARMIRDVNPFEARVLADRLVDERFKSNGAAIEASMADFEAQWKDLLPLYSQVVMESTESPWVHSAYTCVVSSIHPGVSSWSGNKVGVKFDGSPELKRRVLAHEILLSNVFQLVRKRYRSSEIGDWQVWAFSEITPVLILDDPRLRDFWPNVVHAGDYFALSGYPQLSGPEKQLKDLFDRRTSYADYEKKAVAVLRDFQPFRRSWIGLFIHDIKHIDPTQQLAKDMDLSATNGSFVLGIYKGSPADAAGLMVGDYVTAVGSTPIESSAQLTQAVLSLASGTGTSVTVVRLGEEKNLPLTIGERDIRDKVPLAQPQDLWPGFVVANLSAELRAKWGIPEDTRGVAVASMTNEKSPAAVAGLHVQDVITEANGVQVETLLDFYRALNATGGRSATLEISRGGTKISVAL